MSKDILIVSDWNYQCVNWVYVVLSRVRTLAGLYLMKPLDLERGFNVPQNLIRFEQRLKANKERPILDMMGFQSNAEIETMQWRVSESSKSNEKVHRNRNSSLADFDRKQELILVNTSDALRVREKRAEAGEPGEACPGQLYFLLHLLTHHRLHATCLWTRSTGQRQRSFCMRGLFFHPMPSTRLCGHRSNFSKREKMKMDLLIKKLWTTEKTQMAPSGGCGGDLKLLRLFRRRLIEVDIFLIHYCICGCSCIIRIMMKATKRSINHSRGWNQSH